MHTGRTGASISQGPARLLPPSRARLEPVANCSRGFVECSALPREEFLYDFKRRLRAARKRAVLAAEDRGTRVARIPSLAAARPRRALPSRLPSPARAW
jgi:hypothetical protein